MKNIILASTSTLFGDTYLNYLKPTLQTFFEKVTDLVFVPYARPGGISHDAYTDNAKAFFSSLEIQVIGLHTFPDLTAAVQEGKAFFTGGGNTFLLVKQLHEKGLMAVLKAAVESGKPYLGTSAGSNIGGVNMQTTNDMPIVYPPSFATMGLVPFNINAHYLDPDPDSRHNGETRETRIREFHTQSKIPVVGLREGSWIQVKGTDIRTEGQHASRIFEAGKEAYELAPGSKLNF